MQSIHLRNELVRRLMSDDEFRHRAFELVELDPSAVPEGDMIEEYPEIDPDDDDEVYRGSVMFDLNVSVLGHGDVLDCRAIYSATLGDDGSIQAVVTDVVKELEVRFQVLRWFPVFGSKKPNVPFVPRWVDLNAPALISREVFRVVRTLIEVDAQAKREADI